MPPPPNPYGCAASTVALPDDARLMSRFGMRPARSNGQMRLHAGVDIGGRRGQPIFSARGGVVELVGRDADRWGALRGYGNAVVVRHPDEGKWALYAHLDRVDVSPGEAVAAGQQLGTMGATTNGKFPRMVHHLHLEVRHAAPGGASPFPGRYGAFNEDPAEWFAGHGLGFSREGLTWDEAAGACSAGLPLDLVATRGVVPHTGATRGVVTLSGLRGPARLRGLGDARADGGEYEPPLPDPDWFRPSALARFGIPAAGAALGLTGLAVILNAFDR